MIKKGDLFHVQIYWIIALSIIALACINFITLSTARSGTRAKEVGVRKVNGANRRQLIWQFLTESIILSIFALMLAIILIIAFAKPFNELLEIQNSYVYDGIGFIFITLLIFTLFIGMLAGSYPAFLLSAYKPVNVLKGQSGQNIKGMAIRNGLVIFQFMFSIVLIISSMIVYKQLDYLQNKQLGFEKENIIIIKNLIGMYYEDPDMSHEDREIQFATLRQEILKSPTVVNATLMSAMPGNSARNFNISIHPDGAPPDTEHGIPYVNIDGSYTDVFGLEMATGNNFKNELSIPQNIEGILINEKAAQLFGFNNPVGKYVEARLNKRIITENGEKKWVQEKELIPIIGVLKDFHTRDLHQDMISTIFFPQYHDNYFGFFMAVRFMPGSILENIDFLEKTWQNTGVRQTFEYEFFDKELEGLYRKEMNLNQIVRFFTLLAIFIACLGMFGLATLMAARRTKEIGVRKVNGATINEVMIMLNKNFVNRVLLAFIIACPIAYYIMHRWLENFAYRTTLSWWVFALAGGFILVIALFTVSWQSWKAAIRNPIEALRDE
jgi:putative ABC transport system permease protein